MDVTQMTNKEKASAVTNALVKFLLSVTEKQMATSAEIAALPEVAQVVIKELRSTPIPD